MRIERLHPLHFVEVLHLKGVVDFLHQAPYVFLTFQKSLCLLLSVLVGVSQVAPGIPQQVANSISQVTIQFQDTKIYFP